MQEATRSSPLDDDARGDEDDFWDDIGNVDRTPATGDAAGGDNDDDGDLYLQVTLAVVSVPQQQEAQPQEDLCRHDS